MGKYVFARFLIAILTCIFVLPVFAGDGSGDGPNTIMCGDCDGDGYCLVIENGDGKICNSINYSSDCPGSDKKCDILSGTGSGTEGRCRVASNECNCFQDDGKQCDDWSDWSENNKYQRQDCYTHNDYCEYIVDAGTNYRCAAGYYPAGDGNATTIEELNCTACPSWYPKGDNQGPYVNAVSSAGATSVRGCSIQAGTEYGTDNKVEIQDDTGQFDVWFDSSCSHE